MKQRQLEPQPVALSSLSNQPEPKQPNLQGSGKCGNPLASNTIMQKIECTQASKGLSLKAHKHAHK